MIASKTDCSKAPRNSAMPTLSVLLRPRSTELRRQALGSEGVESKRRAVGSDAPSSAYANGNGPFQRAMQDREDTRWSSPFQ